MVLSPSINTAKDIIFGRIRYIGMQIRLYVTPPLDISTSLGFLLILFLNTAPTYLLVDTVYNNCTWDPKHRQNEEDLEYFGSCEGKNKTDTQVVKHIIMNCILCTQARM